MAEKFCTLVAAMLVALTCAGCHTVPACGTRFHDVGGACQKGVCQKSCGGCDEGYRGHHLLSAVQECFWGSTDCGCGEVYWNEWQYDPPDCCDPCDDCYGQYVGPRDCCKRKWIVDPVLWVLAIKGKHCRNDGWYDPCGNWHCCCEGDCGGCGKGCCGKGCDGGGDYYEGEILEGPLPDGFTPDSMLDDVPDPPSVSAAGPSRVARRTIVGELRAAMRGSHR